MTALALVTAPRQPPADLAAERAILGAVLLRGADTIAAVAETGLAAADFTLPSHRAIYAAAAVLDAAGTPIDLVTVLAQLGAEAAKLDGGFAFLSALSDDCPSTEHVAHYAAIVRGKAQARALIACATEAAAGAYGAEDIAAYAGEVETRIASLARNGAASRYEFVVDVMRESLAALAARKDAGAHITGVPTGFADLDAITQGLQPGDLDIVAARPSQGKTGYGMGIALHASLVCQVPALVFSLEMAQRQIVDRILCSEGRIDSSRYRSGMLDAQDWQRLTRAASRIHGGGEKVPLVIDQSSSPTIAAVRATARRFARDPAIVRKGKHAGVIVLDYLQLVKGGGAKGQSREQEVAEVSRGLKAIAKELDMPVIALAQVSRGVEKREDKRPMMSDLRESGAIEQDADRVSFIYRDEFYRKDKSAEPGVAEIIIGKNRNGQTATVKLAFIQQYVRFEDLSKRDAPRAQTRGGSY